MLPPFSCRCVTRPARAPQLSSIEHLALWLIVTAFATAPAAFWLISMTSGFHAMNAVGHVFSQQDRLCVWMSLWLWEIQCTSTKLPQSFVMLCIAYTSDSKLDGLPFSIYYIHRHVAAGFASGQKCEPVESCLEGTTSMYSQYCLKCSWCLGRFSGS